MVMRPKSMATVVVVFCSTPSRLSSLVPGQLSGSSVRRARISVTDPTRVVLPAPRPPATRILMPTGAGPGLRSYASAPPTAIGHLSQDSRIEIARGLARRVLQRVSPRQVDGIPGSDAGGEDVQAEQRQQGDQGKKQDSLAHRPHTPSHGMASEGSGTELRRRRY